MTDFNDQFFEKRLLNLKETQDSITGLSAWCLQHRDSHKAIVCTWLKVLKKVKIDQRLTLFYLANDVIQYSKRKSLQFVESWGTALQKATTLVRDDKVKSKILRLFKIWNERSIYDEVFLSDLCGLLTTSTKKNNNTESAEFQPSVMFEKMKRMELLEDNTNEELTLISESPLRLNDVKNLSSIVKERRTGGLDVEAELEEGISHLHRYVTCLKQEVAERNSLIELLDQGEAFYESQKKEAKVVSNAYKNFGSRVKAMKRKLDELVTTLPSPIPSPDVNAPSPSPHDDIDLPEPYNPASLNTTAQYSQYNTSSSTPAADTSVSSDFYTPTPVGSQEDYTPNTPGFPGGFSSFMGSASLPFDIKKTLFSGDQDTSVTKTSETTNSTDSYEGNKIEVIGSTKQAGAGGPPMVPPPSLSLSAETTAQSSLESILSLLKQQQQPSQSVSTTPYTPAPTSADSNQYIPTQLADSSQYTPTQLASNTPYTASASTDSNQYTPTQLATNTPYATSTSPDPNQYTPMPPPVSSNPYTPRPVPIPNTQYTPSNVTTAQYIPSNVTTDQYTPTNKTGAEYTTSDVTGTQYTPSNMPGVEYTPTNVTSDQYTPSNVGDDQYTPSNVNGAQYTPTNIGASAPYAPSEILSNQFTSSVPLSDSDFTSSIPVPPPQSPIPLVPPPMPPSLFDLDEEFKPPSWLLNAPPPPLPPPSYSPPPDVDSTISFVGSAKNINPLSDVGSSISFVGPAKNINPLPAKFPTWDALPPLLDSPASPPPPSLSLPPMFERTPDYEDANSSGVDVDDRSLPVISRLRKDTDHRHNLPDMDHRASQHRNLISLTGSPKIDTDYRGTPSRSNSLDHCDINGKTVDNTESVDMDLSDGEETGKAQFKGSLNVSTSQVSEGKTTLDIDPALILLDPTAEKLLSSIDIEALTSLNAVRPPANTPRAQSPPAIIPSLNTPRAPPPPPRPRLGFMGPRFRPRRGGPPRFSSPHGMERGGFRPRW